MKDLKELRKSAFRILDKANEKFTLAIITVENDPLSLGWAKTFETFLRTKWEFYVSKETSTRIIVSFDKDGLKSLISMSGDNLLVKSNEHEALEVCPALAGLVLHHQFLSWVINQKILPEDMKGSIKLQVKELEHKHINEFNSEVIETLLLCQVSLKKFLQGRGK